MEKYFNKLGNLKEEKKYLDMISNYSFYLGVFLELTIVLLDKSEYIIQYEGWWFRITFVLFGISLLTCRHSLREWIGLAVFGIVGMISYGTTGRNEILRAVVFIWACQGKDMKKILKFAFWYTLIGCAVIFLLSVTGIYGSVSQEAIYRAEINGVNGIMETRFCFGMGHPNAFHCMILVLTWLGIYCYYEKLNWPGYLAIGTFHIVIYLFTDSRTGLMMSVGSLVIYMVLNYNKKLTQKKWVYIAGIAVLVFGVIVSVLFAVYSTKLPFFAKLDSILTGRIFALMDSNRYEGMVHTWSLWSSPVNVKYFDLGIVRFFYWFGIIPGILYFGAQCRLIWCGYKRQDYMLLAMVVVITIYSVFEAHFISDYLGRNYILFFFGMYLSDMLGEERDDGKTPPGEYHNSGL